MECFTNEVRRRVVDTRYSLGFFCYGHLIFKFISNNDKQQLNISKSFTIYNAFFLRQSFVVFFFRANQKMYHEHELLCSFHLNLLDTVYRKCGLMNVNKHILFSNSFLFSFSSTNVNVCCVILDYGTKILFT